MNPRLEARASEMKTAATKEPQRRDGFAKLPNGALLDFARLMNGTVQILCVLYINSENQWEGKRRWTRPITCEEMAKVTRTTVRAVEGKIKDLVDRKVLTAKKTADGTRYDIPFETWPDLPDMPSTVVEISGETEEAAADDTPEDTKKPAGFPVFEKRLSVPAGRKTKPIKFKGDGAADQIQFDANVDFECDGFLRAGVLRLSIYAKPTGKTLPVKSPQPEETARAATPGPRKTDLIALHELLDDYCLRHHGTIPNEKLLAKIQQNLGKATLEGFKRVFQAKVRSGKTIPMGLFIDLAGDARLAADAVNRRPDRAEVAQADKEIERVKALQKARYNL